LKPPKFMLYAAIFAATLIVGASCSGNLDATLRGDGSVRAAVRLTIPEALSGRVRQLVGLGSREPLFSPEAVRNQFLGRTSINLVDVSSPTPDILTSWSGYRTSTRSSADTSLVPPGLIQYKNTRTGLFPRDAAELSVHLSMRERPLYAQAVSGRGQAHHRQPDPPALESDPSLPNEYRLNLEQVIIGKKNMPAFDVCTVDVAIHRAERFPWQRGEAFRDRSSARSCRSRSAGLWK
jgi:hypothetical protein